MRRCASCGAEGTVEFSQDAFINVCTACGHFAQDIIFRDDPSNEINFANGVRMNESRVRSGPLYSIHGTRLLAQATDLKDRRAAQASRRRPEVYAVIRTTLARLGHPFVAERAQTLFEQVRAAAETASDETKDMIERGATVVAQGRVRTASKHLRNGSPASPVDDAGLKQGAVRAEEKILRWGQASLAMGAAVVYAALRREDKNISIERVAAASEQPLHLVSRQFYRLKSLAGSTFAETFRREPILYISEHFKFFTQQLSSPRKSTLLSTRATSFLKSVDLQRAESLAQDLCALCPGPDFGLPLDPSALSYAIAMHALEGTARKPLCQQDFLQAAATAGIGSSSGQTIATRYVEIRRMLSKWAGQLPWLKSKKRATNRRSRPRKQDRQDGEEDGSDAERGVLSRADLSQCTADVVSFRKSLQSRLESKGRDLQQDDPEGTPQNTTDLTRENQPARSGSKRSLSPSASSSPSTAEPDRDWRTLYATPSLRARVLKRTKLHNHDEDAVLAPPPTDSRVSALIPLRNHTSSDLAQPPTGTGDLEVDDLSQMHALFTFLSSSSTISSDPTSTFSRLALPTPIEALSPSQVDAHLFEPGEMESYLRTPAECAAFARTRAVIGDWDVPEAEPSAPASAAERRTASAGQTQPRQLRRGANLRRTKARGIISAPGSSSGSRGGGGRGACVDASQIPDLELGKVPNTEEGVEIVGDLSDLAHDGDIGPALDPRLFRPINLENAREYDSDWDDDEDEDDEDEDGDGEDQKDQEERLG